MSDETKSLRLEWEHVNEAAYADLVRFDDAAPMCLRVRYGAHFGKDRWTVRIDVVNVHNYRWIAIAPDHPSANRVPDAVLAEAEAWAFGNLRVCGTKPGDGND